MARKTPSRMELRKQAEAAESAGKSTTRKKKKATKKKATRARRAKDKLPERRKLFWVVFNASMKEESRFEYDQRKEAEERLETLKAKSKKPYFIQAIKEVLNADGTVATEVPEKPKAKKKKVKKKANPVQAEESDDDENEVDDEGADEEE